MSKVADAVGTVRAEWRDRYADSVSALVIVGSFAVLLGVMFLQVSFGAHLLTFSEAWGAVLDPTVVFDADVWRAFLPGGDIPGWSTQRQFVVWNIRLPRVLVGVLVGANLAVSGAIFRVVTRNELASPYVLGTSDGAGLVALVTLTFLSGPLPFTPVLAAVGGAIVFLFVYFIAWKNDTSPVRLVPASVAVGTVLGSVQRVMFFFINDLGVVMFAQAWLSGSLLGTDWAQVHIASPSIIVVLGLALAVTKELDVLFLGEETAQSFGMPVEKVRLVVAGIVILSMAAAIAVAGLVGLVGLVVPYMVRNLIGGNLERLLIGCAFLGLASLAGAGVGVRLALSLIRLPVGIITGLVGGPYFLYLIRKKEDIGSV